MKEKLKGLKMHYALTSILEAAVGAVLLVWPDLSLIVVCRLLGGVLLIMGLVHLVGYMAAKEQSLAKHTELFLTIVFLAVGALIALNPKIVAGLIPFIMGAILLVHGLYDFQKAAYLIQNKYRNWGFAFVFALLTIGLGALLLWNPFEAAGMVVRVIGGALIYDAISDLWIMNRSGKVEKNLRKAAMEKGEEIYETVTTYAGTEIQDVVVDPKHPDHVIDEKNIID